MPRFSLSPSVGATACATAVVVPIILAACQPALDRGMTRTYYIAADKVEWDYAPSGRNLIRGAEFGETEDHWMASGPTRVGRIYQKAIYREYTDSTFTTLVTRGPEWEHLGIMGPLIRAEVGDTIRIIYRNNVEFPTSLHPHGVFYDKDSEGTPYDDMTDERDKFDDGVPQGGTHTYVWPVPERAGPAAADQSTVFWMYHSHTEEIRDVNAGLVGPMIVHARGNLGADGTPTDVDREIIVGFLEFDENESWYMEENVQTYMSNPDAIMFTRGPFGDRIATSDMLDWGGNFMETMNGFTYGNLPGMTMRLGERVRWYLMASTNFEIHAPHWHGNTVTINGMRTDVSNIISMGMRVAEMVPDNPGIWLFHCHVGAHLEAGMTSVYTVLPAAEEEVGS